MKTFLTAAARDSARGCFLTLVTMLAMAGCRTPGPDGVYAAEEGEWRRERFEGHIYVRFDRGITHDPDCPCTAPAKPKSDSQGGK